METDTGWTTYGTPRAPGGWKKATGLVLFVVVVFSTVTWAASAHRADHTSTPAPAATPTTVDTFNPKIYYECKDRAAAARLDLALITHYGDPSDYAYVVYRAELDNARTLGCFADFPGWPWTNR